MFFTVTLLVAGEAVDLIGDGVLLAVRVRDGGFDVGNLLQLVACGVRERLVADVCQQNVRAERRNLSWVS